MGPPALQVIFLIISFSILGLAVPHMTDKILCSVSGIFLIVYFLRFVSYCNVFHILSVFWTSSVLGGVPIFSVILVLPCSSSALTALGLPNFQARIHRAGFRVL